MYWLSPDRYQRTIVSTDFSQTLVVNGTKVFEKDSSDYFPLQLRTFVTAMVDPQPILDAVRPGDQVLTKANGAVNESGVRCFGPNGAMCVWDKFGMREEVAASGHGVVFADYQPFEGKRIARVLTNASRLGEEPMMLRVKQLERLDEADSKWLEMPDVTPPQGQMRFLTRSESELRASVLSSQEIIWPQPLDGAVQGTANFFVSIDRTGVVREVKPLYTANERTNDSAVAQLMRWKFKPFDVNGLPAQAEGILTFTLDTRAYGPAETLTGTEARKLATGIVDPDVPAGKYLAGTVYTMRISIDADGNMIEAIAGEGPLELWQPCFDSLKKWTFHPLMENGAPRPYRANIIFPMP
jgi:hypothetical protein